MKHVSADLGTGRASVGAVLGFAWTAGEFTATEVMAGTSLTRSTAIDAVDTLVGGDTLRELPNARAVGDYRAGRPARRFTLSPDLGVVIGVDAGDTHLAVTVADPVDATLAHVRTEVDPLQTPAQRRASIVTQLELSLAEAGRSRADILAICVGVAAPVTRDGVSPPHPEGFWERTNPDLAAALRDWAAIVEIKNDAQLAAIAEGAQGAAIGCRDYVALLAGEHFGGGVVSARVGETLARVVGVLGSMYDPARVIICGAVAESIEPVLSAARTVLPAQLHLPAPELLASSLGAEVVSLGAVAIARQAARERAVPLLAEQRLAARA